VVFVLLTVSVAGEVIARDTTTDWISGAVDKNDLVVANSSMGAQYGQLISAFSGAKPRLILSVMSIQALIVLFSSFAVGLTFGTIINVLVLMQNPIISAFTVLEIALWFFAAIAVMFVFCLVPAFRLAKSSILRIMA
jgi:hypothetical protein